MEPTLFKTYFDLNIKEILSNDLYNFLNMNAISEGTNIGFLFASVLCTVNFLLSTRKSFIEIREGYRRNLNTMMIFVGLPSTGK